MIWQFRGCHSFKPLQLKVDIPVIYLKLPFVVKFYTDIPNFYISVQNLKPQARHVQFTTFMNVARIYLGYTSDLKERIKSHNAGENPATKLNTPYQLIYYSAFRNEQDAIECEKYFKTTAGWKRIHKMLECYLEVNFEFSTFTLAKCGLKVFKYGYTFNTIS